MIGITGASGRLGRLIIEHLLGLGFNKPIAALVRSPEDVSHYPALGIQVRQADYNDPASLGPALTNVNILLLISSNEFGQRLAQHKAVIDAAEKAGIKHILYTSIINADKSPTLLSVEHRETEALLADCKMKTTILRNAWYTENILQNIQPALAVGAGRGAAGEGRFSSASCDDIAQAIAKILMNPEIHEDQVYELCGDTSFTFKDYTDTLSSLSGKDIAYENFSGEAFQAYLENVRFPKDQARLLADAQVHAQDGWFEGHSHKLSELIGRPTTTLSESVSKALKLLTEN